MQLNINHVCYTYPGTSRPVFKDLNTVFATGWTGLIGDNGCGKTTLALIASGLLTPDSGTVFPHLTSAYCPQDSSIRPARLEDFAVDWDKDAVRIRKQLEIDDDWAWSYDRLSGGQQKRLQIACALWEQPDVLVLDEPTNDVDAETREAVAAACSAFRGIGLLISHDRELLDKLASRCLVFGPNSVTLRPGGFSSASRQTEEDRARQARQRAEAKREVARLTSEAQRRSEVSARSQSRLSARNLDKHDSDARERLGRAKVTGKDTVAGRASAVMSRRLERATEQAASISVEKRYNPQIQPFGCVSPSKCIAHIPASEFGNHEFRLKVPELWIGPTDHVGISGRNGSGKSTLLRQVLVRVPESVRVAYIPQSVNKSERDEALRSLHSLDKASAGQALSLVARLNSDPERLMDGADVSPGELRKLMLAVQLLQKPHCLVLDEPTNHLDVGSIQALQLMLAEFPGSLVLVSHDNMLLEASCPIRWSITEQQDGAHLLTVG